MVKKRKKAQDYFLGLILLHNPKIAICSRSNPKILGFGFRCNAAFLLAAEMTNWIWFEVAQDLRDKSGNATVVGQQFIFSV